jgi:plasmid stabilization system protein ParE
MAQVRFTAAASADLSDAVTWYEHHAPEFVAHFRQAVRTVVQRIETNPKQFPPAPHGTRQALLRRFPYLMIFRETDEAAYVVAVFHSRRDPRTWQHRTS